jgi:aspartyl-tRNA(Asn)/glutamyl-tRNA(Gln) amidotransferase subunit A
MKLNELTIKEARERLDKGEITALELTNACLKEIALKDSEIKTCLTVCADSARAEAQEADKRIKAGDKGALLGIPYLCKDNLMTKGIRTTAASKMLENYIAPYDATVIKHLKEAGAILLGKTNLDEFAHGASTENSAFFVTKNPHDLSRVPGGSSGGSAAAVAANLCLFALGSDTGGSIRQPASFCGIVGLKPSYGRISRFGLLSMTSSTDVVGTFTKTVADAALVLDIIAGADENDATSAPADFISETKTLARQTKTSGSAGAFNLDNSSGSTNTTSSASLVNAIDFSQLKVGLPKEYFTKDLDPKVKEKIMAVANKLKSLGAEIINVSLPNTKYGIPVYYLITPSEISSNLARFDGIGWGRAAKADNLQDFYRKSRGAGFGPEVKRRIMLGTFALSAGYYDAYYKKAQAVRTLIINDFNQAFKQVDIILTPTSPHPAFKIGAQNHDPLTMYLEDVFVTGASLAGLPALSIPAGKIKVANQELPIGAQLIGQRFFEEELLAVADKLN